MALAPTTLRRRSASTLSEERFLADAEAAGSAREPCSAATGRRCSRVRALCLPWGELATQAPSFEEALLVCDIDPHAEGPRASARAGSLRSSSLPWGALTLGLHDLCEKTGNNDIAVLLDGSLDSMVVAALATDALGPTRVHALVLDDADEQGCSRVVPSTCATSGSIRASNPVPPSVRKAIVRLPRHRRAHLAALAREIGGIALSNLDKTALALEVDVRAVSAARVMPIGDLYRSTTVIELARLRNTISPVISRGAQNAYEVPDVDEPRNAEPPTRSASRTSTTCSRAMWSGSAAHPTSLPTMGTPRWWKRSSAARATTGSPVRGGHLHHGLLEDHLRHAQPHRHGLA